MLKADDGEIIAKKLSAEIKPLSSKHKNVVVKINGKYIGRFGIRRGSGELNHNYIAHQLRMSLRDAEEISGCRKGLEDYVEILKEKGLYPD